MILMPFQRRRNAISKCNRSREVLTKLGPLGSAAT
jgi:hypothetical protein